MLKSTIFVFNVSLKNRKSMKHKIVCIYLNYFLLVFVLLLSSCDLFDVSETKSGDGKTIIDSSLITDGSQTVAENMRFELDIYRWYGRVTVFRLEIGLDSSIRHLDFCSGYIDIAVNDKIFRLDDFTLSSGGTYIYSRTEEEIALQANDVVIVTINIPFCPIVQEVIIVPQAPVLLSSSSQFIDNKRFVDIRFDNRVSGSSRVGIDMDVLFKRVNSDHLISRNNYVYQSGKEWSRFLMDTSRYYSDSNYQYLGFKARGYTTVTFPVVGFGEYSDISVQSGNSNELTGL